MLRGAVFLVSSQGDHIYVISDCSWNSDCCRCSRIDFKNIKRRRNAIAELFRHTPSLSNAGTISQHISKLEKGKLFISISLGECCAKEDRHKYIGIAVHTPFFLARQCWSMVVKLKTFDFNKNVGLD